MSSSNQNPPPERGEPGTDSSDNEGALTSDPVSAPDGISKGDAWSFPVVGIGASAGGLEAFKLFLQAMPADSGLAFVLIQHLDPTHQSMMSELLARYTAMRVLEVEDDMLLQPDTVYMIPPNKYLFVKEGRLHLTEPLTRRGMRLPIDYFFRSLAEEFQEHAICIVLSGTGSDGAQCLRSVKGEGGIVLAQNPDSAQYDGMPRSAIATGLVDFVLRVEEMPEALLKYVKHPGWHGGVAGMMSPPEKNDLQPILALLHARTNHDFSCYKRGTLTRRIHRRTVLRNCDSYRTYLSILREDGDEVRALLRDLLIGVTAFFRDPEAWEQLEKKVLRDVLAGKEPDSQFRAWVPGCCSGEEAFSLAILVVELQEKLGIGCDVQIFASDIDEAALEVARSGLYPESIVAAVTPERLQRFFVQEGQHYRVHKRIRDLVVFANQNLVRDPPFSRLDLVSCRNLLIYLDAAVQKQLIALMHFSLNEEGYLFLGSSESVTQQEQLFKPLSKKWRIYKRVDINARFLHNFKPMSGGDELRSRLRYDGLPRDPRPGSVTALAHEILLREYVPASVLVNRRGEAIYYHGPVFRYLQVASGEPTRNIAEMAGESLRVKLRSAMQRCMRKNELVEVIARNSAAGEHELVVIRVRPLDAPKVGDGLLLVTFEETKLAEEVRQTSLPDEQVPEELQQLEYELTATREDLQSTIEELEISNEELKASNEEVMSMNEELQSTNEELETSKEELHSLNEEMITVNNQLHDQVQDLEAANSDIANLLNSTSVATLFLDRKLRVRRFTPSATKLFRLIPADIGRSLEDIRLRYTDGDLMEQAHSVLATLQPFEEVVVSDEGNSYLYRIFPYRTLDDRIDGLVLTFVDITELKQTQEALQTAQSRLRALVDSTTDAIYIKDMQGKFVSLNQSAADNLGKPCEEILGRDDSEFLTEEAAKIIMQTDAEIIKKGEIITLEEHVPILDGSARTFQSTKGPIRTEDGTIIGLFGISRDITESKRLEQEHREAILQEKHLAEAANHAKTVFLTNMSHEIRTPLSALLGMARLGKQKSVDNETQALFSHIADAGDHLLAVLNDILDLSKITAGKLGIDSRPFVPAELLEHCGAIVRDSAEEKGLGFNIEDSQKLPECVLGDAQRLTQILLNLLSNAVKFTEQGSVTLSMQREGDMTHFVVRDTGIGMTDEQLQRLFLPFEQADDSLTRSAGGSGLGLTISRSLAHLMDGDISVTSRPGRGSCFTLSLPLPEVNVPVTEPVPAVQVAGAALADYRILAVEDCSLNRTFLSFMLEDAVARLEFAHDGQQAVEKVEAEPDGFDVVLMDVQMPVMDGYEATRKIKAIEPDLPVIGVTAHALKGDNSKGLEAGMDAYLTKPFDIPDLMSAILRHTPGRKVSGPQVKETENMAEASELVDWPALQKKYNAKSGVLGELIDMALEKGKEMSPELRAAAKRKQYAELATLAHALAGESAILLSPQVTGLARQVEQAAREQRDEVFSLAERLAEVNEQWKQELCQGK
ncbi:MAG: chemotaxis protein CheB [Thiolinea sp.]